MLGGSFQGLSIHMRYLHKAKGRQTYTYRRVVPLDLRDHYQGREIIRSLQTHEEAAAIKACAKLNKQVEAEFLRLRSGLPKQGEAGQHGLGLSLLRQFGIQPQHFQQSEMEGEGEMEAFAEHLEQTFQSVLPKEEMEALRWNRARANFTKLPKAEKAAIEILRGEFSLHASEYPAEFLRLKGREQDRKFANDMELAIKFLLAALPDKSPGDYRRHELHELIAHHLQRGLSTGSIQKRLAMLRSMFNLVSRELEIDRDQDHPFNHWQIPNYGEDKVDRVDFSFDQLNELRAAPAARSAEIRWLIHLMLETGLRVNECCGLMTVDVFLDDQYPHLILHQNPFRRLKTKHSQRFVPLVGVGLEAVMQAVEGAGEWLFPRYVDLDKQTTKNTSASNAINKRLRALLGQGSPSCHSFRHVMQTRLREVGCPEHLRNELGGWSKSISQSYGSTSDLKHKTDYLTQASTVRYRTFI